ncbi:DNA ligase D [Halobacillus salinarum]|uniref:DNA ligase (ATP) n=1 Tax=Halobacillus salinarum TaxID=2932257 RepID=A0ABY4EML1_9BACI|nr:DNA ligase D [Halobacillus salinarum]UOQ45093.1 DNA ligase D [Halobacillus salinarum]
MIKPMLLTMSDDVPEGKDWLYEIKYDGYRALLFCTESDCRLISRNGKDLSAQFPEIIEAAARFNHTHLPLTLDGELVILNNPYQANFARLQQRGRLQNHDKIIAASQSRPATYMAFDFLTDNDHPYKKRKKQLASFLKSFPSSRIQYVETYDDSEEIHKIASLHLSEGIIAKHKQSRYEPGHRTKQWIKTKLWKDVSGFLTRFDPQNSYYHMEIWDKGQRVPLGSVKNGIESEQSQTLRTFFKKHGTQRGKKWELAPSICADVHCLGAENGELREPVFSQFRFDLEPDDCTVEKRDFDLAVIPEEIGASKLEKELWPRVTKRDYLIYLRHIAPYQLSFLKQKKVTLIRYPDGIGEHSFFQKHRPDYAPEFIESWENDGEQFMLCNDLSSLLWMGNHGALEFHIPFQKVSSSYPDEIVFDLDPPSRSEFSLAVTAAQLIKHLMDQLDMISFVKTSGNKGMQLHIPIEEGALTYEETRGFTEAIARLLVKEKPDIFTIERLKKNRGNRLYLDYIQHAEGKTIVAPYSARATEKATVAAPLFWEELTEDLSPESFTILNTIARIRQRGCPFKDYDRVRKQQPVEQIKKWFLS